MSHDCIRTIIGSFRLNKRLLLHSVQVFMNTIQNEVESFVAVMLVISFEIRLELAQCSFELKWR